MPKVKKGKNSDSNDIDMDDLIYFMKLSVKEKLAHLEKLRKFFYKVTPKANIKIWAQLRDKGY
ncbi:hypothetical protein K1X76_12915 [bacterium]|nr:hypothetical protein [bacterium]